MSSARLGWGGREPPPDSRRKLSETQPDGGGGVRSRCQTAHIAVVGNFSPLGGVSDAVGIEFQARLEVRSRYTGACRRAESDG